MRTYLTIAFVILAALVGASGAAGLGASGASPTDDQSAGAPTSNGWEVTLYRQLAARDGNQLVSPLSLKAAFALIYPGARGQSADEIAQVFDLSGNDVASARQARLIQDLQSSGVFKSANAVWVDQRFTLARDYRHQVADDLHAQIEALDFQRAPEASRLHINAWASAETNARIPELLPAGFIASDTELVLANAVYFKADWMAPFAPSATREASFHPLGGGDQRALMMHGLRRGRYIEGDGFQAADFDFKDGRFALTIFLPRGRDGLAAFERRLSPGQLLGWLTQINGAAEARLDVALPKLRLEGRYELAPMLKAMGLRAVFSDHADLAGISPDARLKISRVAQNTFLAMDEAGVEAAAATGIGIVATAMPRPQAPPIVFNVDHPFLLALRDRNSGAIVFMGRVATLAGAS